LNTTELFLVDQRTRGEILLKVKFQTDKFNKEMNSILNYASGFLDGAQAGKKELMQTIGEKDHRIPGRLH